ncbi:MAG: methylated-DNA--[protein]-cysteine S-methyltransferase, partial [Candidatus Heimdallarchaeota archaeon]|nr:methylated-DNA--[protein]-cysteine S-methyltransferase [Candidatus Heimdallarchaeota archaeon]
MSEVFIEYFKSPIGYIEVVSSYTRILKSNFVRYKKALSKNLPPIMKEAVEQLDSYFDGKLQVFNLDLDFLGTNFQLKVWNELQKIPFGHTITYTELAERICNKNAIRAVGNANAKNPISIIIPCHRVIGSDGKLRGYGG